jgi:hypothetical protein
MCVSTTVSKYTADALSKWSKQSQDREFLEKLYATVFSKFQRIISRLSKIIPFSEGDRPETVENIRRFPRLNRDLDAFRDSWDGLRDNRLDNTEFDNLMKMVWKIGQDEDSIDEAERVDWKDVLENPDKY